MEFARLYHSIRMCFILNPTGRAIYIKKHNIFSECGEHCMFMFRKIPLYPKLIKCHNNVRIASNVTLCTHDAIHHMVNYAFKLKNPLNEKIGCIEIQDNVFIGTNTTIMYDTKIGPNVIVAANSLVNKDIKDGVWGGIPAKYICSIEEYIEKRKCEQLEGKLFSKTNEKMWENFRKKHS
ncbi:acyltransferase [Blautia sp. MSJ-9]|uniref:acyltransferase n=1 Tax=Blautia sp. MSJ-9 TaxID=2841511 RepID=UPI001C11E524|nr:acyltransferase [Blautia sp. MSJ-9]MBU5681109.1 acyltransferase [Blautia sp. MSJ-9]